MEPELGGFLDDIERGILVWALSENDASRFLDLDKCLDIVFENHTSMATPFSLQ